jgi:hypothetical protein
MPCEHYKDALIEAAASGAEPQGDLRAHLDACASCRAACEQEQALFASIDAGLHVSANAEVPASLLPRVRAQLNDPSASRIAWVPAWALLAVTAALALVVLSVRGRRHDASGQNLQSSTVAHTVLPAEIPPVRVGALPPTSRGNRMNKRSLPSNIQTYVFIEQIPVLLPAGQKEVIDGWLGELRRGKVNEGNLLARKSDLPLRDLQISSLDVPPIEMKPLADVSGESPSQSGKARR